MKPVLEDVAPGMPASRGGLKEGDVISRGGWATDPVVGTIYGTRARFDGKALSLDIERKGQPMHLVVTPQSGATERGETVYQIGVQVHEETAYRRVAFGESVKFAASNTYDTIDEHDRRCRQIVQRARVRETTAKRCRNFSRGGASGTQGRLGRDHADGSDQRQPWHPELAADSDS